MTAYNYNPCKNCNSRHTGCHIDCAKGKIGAAIMEAKRNRMRKYNEDFGFNIAYGSDKTVKRVLKHAGERM